MINSFTDHLNSLQLSHHNEVEKTKSFKVKILLSIISIVTGLILLCIAAVLLAFPSIAPFPLAISLFVVGLAIASCGIGMLVGFSRKKIISDEKINILVNTTDKLKKIDSYLSQAEVLLAENAESSRKFKEESEEDFKCSLQRLKGKFDDICAKLDPSKEGVIIIEECSSPEINNLKDECSRFLSICSLYGFLTKCEIDVSNWCLEKSVPLECANEMIESLLNRVELNRLAQTVLLEEPDLFSTAEFIVSSMQLSKQLTDKEAAILNMKKIFNEVLDSGNFQELQNELMKIQASLRERMTFFQSIVKLAFAQESFNASAVNIRKSLTNSRNRLDNLAQTFEQLFRGVHFPEDEMIYNKTHECLSYINSRHLWSSSTDILQLRDCSAQLKASSNLVEIIRGLQSKNLSVAKSFLLEHCDQLESIRSLKSSVLLSQRFEVAVRVFLSDLIRLTERSSPDSDEVIEDLVLRANQMSAAYDFQCPQGAVTGSLDSLWAAAEFLNVRLGEEVVGEKIIEMESQMTNSLLSELLDFEEVTLIEGVSEEELETGFLNFLENAHNKCCQKYREAKIKQQKINETLLEADQEFESKKDQLKSLKQKFDSFSQIEPLITRRAVAEASLVAARRERRPSHEESAECTAIMEQIQSMKGLSPWQRHCLNSLDYEVAEGFKDWIRTGAARNRELSSVLSLRWMRLIRMNTDNWMLDSLPLIFSKCSEEEALMDSTFLKMEEFSETSGLIVECLETLGCSSSLDGIRAEVETIKLEKTRYSEIREASMRQFQLHLAPLMTVNQEAMDDLNPNEDQERNAE